MSKRHDNSSYKTAKKRNHFDELRKDVYERVKELHIQKYPYNDFLYQIYDEETEE